MNTTDHSGKCGSATLSRLFLGVLGAAALSASAASATVKVEELPLGPDGDIVGCAVSPHGGHVAVLANKGSRFVVLLDNVEGPRIDALLSGVYSGPAGVGTYPNGQIPVLFSNDGSHSAYIGKIGDEYVVMEDGKELCRGPFVSNGMSNMTVQLTFSPGGKHLFFMNFDGGKYHVVVDGKPGPPTGISQPLIISPDGEHYAYGGFTNSSLGNGVPNWAVVDGQQVNYVGDMQYTAKNVLLSTLPFQGNTLLLLNGKPSIKAYGINPIWISPDGAQIAMMITPTSGQPPIFSVDGKTIPLDQGMSVGYLYFSPDGKRWAALCNDRTGSKCMMIDGKKGEMYQSIANQSPAADYYQRWTWVNGKTPASSSDVGIAVPGFTADSSQFVYVASQGGRQFMVVNEDESNGFSSQQTLAPILSPVGHRIGVIGVAPNGKQHVILDGQEKEYGPPNGAGGIPGRINYLTFTPDGTRYAMINGPHLVVDGVALGGTNPGM
jgi:Tol biopolymer transport system component